MTRRFLEPMGKQITTAGLGTLSEIFDGDAPFHHEAVSPKPGPSGKFCVRGGPRSPEWLG
jgi:hypothetical protein